MLKEIIATGKDVTAAQENARAALGAGPLDDVKFEIIELGSRGFLGFMAKPAKVKAIIEVPDAHEPKPKRERPQRERNNDEKKENKPEAKQQNKQGAKKNHNKGPKKPRENNGEKAEKIHVEAISENSLKMERKFVGEGEDMSYEFVKTLLSDIGLEAEAELYSCDDGTRRITIVGNDASTLIGHHGDTLDALQYLANLASARKNVNGERDKSRVTIDIEGYRAKREETLRALARRMAAKALKNRRSVMLEPMTPYERRIIHSEIQGIEGVSTNSIGSDNNRKIVIFLTDKKPKEIFEEQTKTPLAEEFAQNEEDTVSVEDINVSVESDLAAEDEAVTVKQTYPDDSEACADLVDDSDIK